MREIEITECCLNGFIRKSNKDYQKAIIEAERIFEEYLNTKDYENL
jgi:hypothetical protein